MDVTEPVLVQYEPECPERIKTELANEIRRLCEGSPREIDWVYERFPGPASRRRQLQKMSGPRIRAALQQSKEYRSGAVELSIICFDHRVDFELSYAKRLDDLQSAGCAVDYIPLRLHADELGPVGK